MYVPTEISIFVRAEIVLGNCKSLTIGTSIICMCQ